MSTKTLKIHTENILPIIKKWLYSDKDIFVRELIANSCDAISKVRTLRDHGELSAADEEFRIDLSVDKKAQTLTFTDTGIGMSAEEVEKYIAQIAFSGAEEFLSKYKSQSEKDQMIGHFGLGFYSAYMVAKTVTINTRSYRENEQAVFWSCDGASEYLLEEGSRATRGTEITLFIDKENEEFLEEARLRSILQHYCSFLPYPIFLNGSRINHKEPLWLKNPTACTDQEYLEFYRFLYPLDPDPLFWVHLNVDYPFNLKGILYFPKLHKQFDFQKSYLKLFCNRVFVSDQCKDLMPDFLAMLRGALDSPDIPLNVSRSYLQMDRTVRQLATHISKKVADKLLSFYAHERDKFLSAWEDIHVIIKLGSLQDDKFFERAKEFLVWKNVKGEWTTLESYSERHKEAYKNKFFYTVEHSPIAALYTNKDIEVLIAGHPVDSAVMNHYEMKVEGTKFQRIDGALDEIILDPAREKTLLDAEGKTESGRVSDFFRKALKDVEVEAKSLTSSDLPAFVMVDETMRRMREFLAFSDKTLPETKKTFVVNTNSSLIQSIYQMQEKKPELAEEMAKHLYELSLLSQKELAPNHLKDFIERSHRVLEKLSQ